MAVDAFLKLDGIKGESQDSKHKDEIEIESFSWGVTQSGTLAFGGGGGAGKAQFQDFHFTNKVSKASPQLFIKCVTGEHIKVGTLSVRKAGGDRAGIDFYKITLSDVLVSSYQSGGNAGGDIPADQFSLNFAKVEYSFATQKPDGTIGETINAGFDLKQNKKA